MIRQELIAILLLCASCTVGPVGGPDTTASASPEPAALSNLENQSTWTQAPDDRMLFIGNSLTYWRHGVNEFVVELAASADPARVVRADAVVRGGVSLEYLWEISNAPQVIREGEYDMVVLQEDLSISDVKSFHTYTREFEAEITGTGAELVLYMPWRYEDEDSISMEEVTQAHQEIASELGIEIAPVGLAFERAREVRPELNLLLSEGIHSSIHGTYLASIVIYATIFDEDPSGLTYHPDEITEEEAAFLKRIAWETIHADEKP